jgi:hypothetical protein
MVLVGHGKKRKLLHLTVKANVFYGLNQIKVKKEYQVDSDNWMSLIFR